jgi:hypothetical protein
VQTGAKVVKCQQSQVSKGLHFEMLKYWAWVHDKSPLAHRKISWRSNLDGPTN